LHTLRALAPEESYFLIASHQLRRYGIMSFTEVPMPSTAIAKKISPMLAVANMDETLLFYQNVLGFTPTMKSSEYSIVQRDGQTIHFQKAASDEVMKCVRGHTEIYIEVSGIDSLWQHVQSFKNRYRIRDLFDREYDMTEFHIEDPNGCLVFVGEPTSGYQSPSAP
jgi:catechol 2,3-dioxygenase-like lactoylglutathione lyase family enzyme